MFEFKLPDLGEGIHEGEILRWHVQPGDTIAEDAPLVDVETDKAAVTIPSPRAGRVVSVVGKPGDVVHVGQVIAVIEDAAGAPASASPAAPPPGPAAGAPEDRTTPPAAPASPASPAATPTPAPGPVPAAPATRRLARELGVPLAEVTPTGPGGRVTADDVRRFAERRAAGAAAPPPAAPPAEPGTAAPAPSEELAHAEFAAHAACTIPLLDIEPLPDFTPLGPVEREPLRSIRRKVARKMVTSSILVPHVAHMDEADVTLLEEFRHQERERRRGQPGERLTLLAFVVRAVVAALRDAPAFNASVDPLREEILYKKFYNIGIAVDSGRGLVVPVIRGADRKTIVQLAESIEDLARRGREGKLEVEDLRGGTFTITNVGPLGGTALIPIINYPETAILGMGRVQERPVVRDGQIVIRRILPLTLAFDHRVADGADAARFVNTLTRLLSDPRELLMQT